MKQKKEQETPRAWGGGRAFTDGERLNKKERSHKHHLLHFTQGHLCSQSNFNTEFVLFHNKYLAEPLKSVSEYLRIIHWRDRLLAFNNVTVQRCSFLVLFLALEDLWVEFSQSSGKYQNKTLALHAGALSHGQTGAPSHSISGGRQKRRLSPEAFTRELMKHSCLTQLFPVERDG